MSDNSELTIRIYILDGEGVAQDQRHTFDVAAFGGLLPAVGDTILDPGVLSGLDRADPANRRVWTVRQRIFNPRDLANYVVLVVEERAGTRADTWAF